MIICFSLTPRLQDEFLVECRRLSEPVPFRYIGQLLGRNEGACRLHFFQVQRKPVYRRIIDVLDGVAKRNPLHRVSRLSCYIFLCGRLMRNSADWSFLESSRGESCVLNSSFHNSSVLSPSFSNPRFLDTCLLLLACAIPSVASP